MIADQYVWLVWSSAFLVPWSVLYWLFPAYRRAMLWSSLFTALFGLTEPLFVPEYWSPPSLFDLARRTGFDVESLIFTFGIGGIGVVLYNAVTRRAMVPVAAGERRHSRHRHHRWALASPLLVFPVFYFLPWNPIYPGILAMFVGAAAAVVCRPDLKVKTFWGGVLFLLYYLVFLVGLEWSAPGYIDRVWNLEALSGVQLWEFPLEEFLFAFSFGMYWSGVYEHVTWMRPAKVGATLE